MGREVRVLTAALALALAAPAAHGVVHAAIPVWNPGWQLAYVAVVLFVAPVAGVLDARRGHLRRGAALVAGAGVAGLTFEGPFHFVLANPDHVAHVTRAQLPFAATAALSTAGSLLVAVVGGWVWWTAPR